MTVRDLMEELEGMDPDSAVVFTCDYGDHCHTQQALPVESVDQVYGSDFRESAYSKSGIAIVQDDREDYGEVPEDETEEGCMPVCVLNIPGY